MKSRTQYLQLAELFRYPLPGYRDRVGECAQYLAENYPAAYQKLTPFLTYIDAHSDHEIEEIFGKTFHIQAVCYLDIGYVLFAEDYKRGEFLVHMKKELEKAGIDSGEELADNLPNVLELMARLDDQEFLEEFAVRIVKPALRKMDQEFEESRMALKDKVRRKKMKVIIMEEAEGKNTFQYAIECLAAVVQEDFQHVSFDDPEIVPTLGGSVGTVLSGNCGTSCGTPATASLAQN